MIQFLLYLQGDIMNLNLAHLPVKHISLYFFCIPVFDFKMDLDQAVKEKLNNGQKLTNDLAIKIFKEIKLKSDVLSFLTKSVVFITLSATVSIIGFLLPLTGIVLGILKVTLCLLGGYLVGMVMKLPNNFLSQVSQAYSEQSKQAAEYILQLESSKQEFVILTNMQPPESNLFHD